MLSKNSIYQVLRIILIFSKLNQFRVLIALMSDRYMQFESSLGTHKSGSWLGCGSNCLRNRARFLSKDQCALENWNYSLLPTKFPLRWPQPVPHVPLNKNISSLHASFPPPYTIIIVNPILLYIQSNAGLKRWHQYIKKRTSH